MARAAAGLALLLLLLLAPGTAQAACLGGPQARALIASGQVLPLSSIVAGVQGSGQAEVVNGQLCANGGGYVYRLTVLGRRGHVRHIVVDARTGQVIGGR